jgi:hypothetical protein
MVTREHCGGRGRPRVVIDPSFLREAVEHQHLPLSELSKALGIHRHTLRHCLNTNSIRWEYSNISDDDLDVIVREYKAAKPDTGFRYLKGYLRGRNIKLQENRILASLRRVDMLRITLRMNQPISRREYVVPRPNALWHVDGHHKLIRWGIVIHGFIDGYCRTVCFH